MYGAYTVNMLYMLSFYPFFKEEGGNFGLHHKKSQKYLYKT